MCFKTLLKRQLPGFSCGLFNELPNGRNNQKSSQFMKLIHKDKHQLFSFFPQTTEPSDPVICLEGLWQVVRWLQVSLSVIHLFSEHDICLPRGCSSLFSSLRALVSLAGSNWELGIFVTTSLFVMSLLWWQGVLKLPFSAREPQHGLECKFNNIGVWF